MSKKEFAIIFPDKERKLCTIMIMTVKQFSIKDRFWIKLEDTNMKKCPLKVITFEQVN